MSGKIFLGRTTGQVLDQSSKHPETARMVFTGTPWEWLCPKWSPHWSLKQISKENVRLFCSGSVICHTKRLSLTSGDVSCTLCRTDLLPADMPVLSMQLSPCTLCPPLSAHTSAVFQFLLQAAAEHLSLSQTRVLVISIWIVHCNGFFTVSAQRLLFFKKE